MAAARKTPLRDLEAGEREALEHLARSQAEPATRVARAKELIAVAEGCSYAQAARAAGRKSNDAVSRLVNRFNHEGLRALDLHHGGGHPVQYDHEKQAEIIERFRVAPDRKVDGTCKWSLTTLQARLRKDGLKQVSTFTVWKALHEAGLSWQKNRTWMETGKTIRMRKDGPVEVEDPDKGTKKNSSRRRTRRLKSWV